MSYSAQQTAQILREHAELMQSAVLSAIERKVSPELGGYLALAKSNGWDNLVAAIGTIIGGERNPAALGELDAEDSLIVSTILNTLANPAEFSNHLLSQSIQFLRQGYLQPAEVKARDACLLAPDNANAFAQLGFVTAALGRSEEAEAAYRRSLSLNPSQPAVRLNLGVVLQDLKRFDEAMQVFEEAVRMQPDQIEAMAHLAYLYERAFSLEKAREQVARGLEINPQHAALRFIEGKLRQRDGDVQGAIASFENALKAGLPDVLVSEAHSRLGYLHDRQGEVEKAYGHFSEGNRVAAEQNRQKGVGKESYLAEIDHIAVLAEAVSKADLALSVPHGTDDAPVFLVGFPRSGTTLLNQILDSHPGIQAVEEKPAVYNVVQAFLKMTAGRERPLIDVGQEELERLRRIYFETIDQYIDRRADAVLVDKLPLNIAYAPVIWRVFPEARFIFALRHPCDACLSCFMHSFGANAAMANFTSLADTIDLYSRVMGRWEKFIDLFGLNVHRIRYEDLVDDFGRETADLLDFLGCGWDDAVNEHTERARRRGVVDTPSYDQITEPLYSRAVFRWSRYRNELEPYMSKLMPYIERYGYPA